MPPPPDSQIAEAETTNDLNLETDHNRYIVMFKQQPSSIAGSQASELAVQKTNTVFSALDLSQDSLIHQYKWASFGFAGHFSSEQADRLRSHPLVDHVVKDYYFKALEFSPVATFSALVTLGSYASQITPWGVNRVNGPLDGTGKTVWILDTGIDLDHPDLNVDVGMSTSFVSGESADDINGHGTAVSGIVAAIDNSRDVVGVAAGASIVGVKVCDAGGGCFVSDVKAGVEYAANNFASGDVVNMSLTFGLGPGISDLENSIKTTANSGLKFAVAAGNDSDDASNYSPARIEDNDISTTSAYDKNDIYLSISNFGNPPIEYGGPGFDIPTLAIGGGITNESGTSMATPHITGLLLAKPKNIYTDGFVSNDPDGNPDPIGVYSPFSPPTPGNLSVSISGPSTITKGETVTYTADAIDGDKPYSYTWFYTYTECSPGASDCSDEGVKYVGGQGDSYNFSYTPNYNEVLIEVEVTDDKDDTAADSREVLISDHSKATEAS